MACDDCFEGTRIVSTLYESMLRDRAEDIVSGGINQYLLPQSHPKSPQTQKGERCGKFPQCQTKSPNLLASEPLGSEQPSPTPPNMGVLAGEEIFPCLLPHLRASRSIADLNCCCPTQPCRVSFAASPFLSSPLESLSHCQHCDVGPCKLSSSVPAGQLQEQQGDLCGETTPKVNRLHSTMRWSFQAHTH